MGLWGWLGSAALGGIRSWFARLAGWASWGPSRAGAAATCGGTTGFALGRALALEVVASYFGWGAGLAFRPGGLGHMAVLGCILIRLVVLFGAGS